MLLRSISRFTARESCNLQRVKTIRNLIHSSASCSKFIATHDGAFHCDDVTACFMLKQLPTFKDHYIVRTRNRNILNSADIVVDVGGVFDSEARRFDHHQRTFQLTVKDFHPSIKSTNPKKPIRLSSAGLIYAHYGKDLIQEVLKTTTNDCDRLNNVVDEKMLDAIYEQLYGTFIEEIDAIDNGVEVVYGDNIVYNYSISTSLASRIRRLNTQESASDRLNFEHAMSVAGQELIDCIKELATSWWPSLCSMKECAMNRYNLDKSGAIVQVPQSTNWKTTIFKIEEELSIVGEIKYVLHNSPPSATWQITAVPVSPKSIRSRLPLREDWRGLQDDALCQESGIPDAVFVHATGFIGGASSKEGCLALARKSLDIDSHSAQQRQ